MNLKLHVNKNRHTKIRNLGLSMMVLASAATVAMAGPLNPPPGPITATMKTLAEVEPRMAINATNTPGNTGAMFVISQPGSYYLTSDVTVEAGKYGVQIAADNVTVDLNGFTIRGLTGSSAGVYAYARNHPKVRNGRILDVDSLGVYFVHAPSSNQGAVIEDVVVERASSNGASITGGIIRNCQFIQNGGGVWCDGFNDVLIENSVAIRNGSAGFSIKRGTIKNCSASYNDGAGAIVSTGLVSEFMSDSNTHGVMIESGSVLDSVCSNSSNIGILASGECLIRGNSITNPTFVANTIGIKIQNTNGAKVQDNQITRMATGISSLTTSHYIVSNTLRGCTTAMNVAAGSRVGTIVTGTSSAAINGNSGGGLGTTDPFANILY